MSSWPCVNNGSLLQKYSTDLLFSRTKESGRSEGLIVMPFPTSQSRFRNSSIFISHTFCTSHLSISQLTLALFLLFSLSNGVWCCRKLRGGRFVCVCVCVWSVLSLIAGVVVLKSSGEPHRAGGVKLNKHHPSGELPLRAAVSLPCLPATQLSSSPREPSGTTHLSSGGSGMVEHRRGRSVTDSCCVNGWK